MSFIDNVTKTTEKIGDIVKKTYGPLSPLDAVIAPDNLRYPLDVGDQRIYPHTIEFQSWKPTPTPIGDTVPVQTVQDKATNAAIATANAAKSLGNKVLGVLGGNSQRFEQQSYVNNLLDAYELDEQGRFKTPKVVRNMSLNPRVMDFTRRSERSDMMTMYIPQGSWMDRVGNAYDQRSLTEAFGALGAVIDIGASIMRTMEEDTTITERVKKAFNNTVNGPTGMEVIGAVAGAVGMDGKTVRDAGLASIGYAMNPQFEVFYGGTEMREFQFDFTMTPRNAKEAEAIRHIIRKFKYHASPQYVSALAGRYLIPPSYFDITFKFNGADSKWLPQISTCVLKTVDIDYTGGLEQFATYEDGSPVQVKMTLQFVELEMMHKTLREEGY